MDFISIALVIVGVAAEAALLFRARRGRFLSQFPFFYSYLTYVLASSIIAFPLYFLKPQLYPTVYWFSYLVILLAEFAVLMEVSDHIFEPYPAIRRLGQLLTAVVCLIFFAAYVVPSMMQRRPSSIALLEFEKRTSLTKAILILTLLAAARLYRLPLGKNISGIMLGFATYLTMVIASDVLAETFGRSIFGVVYNLMEPLGYLLALSIWVVALWQFEPVTAGGRNFSGGASNIAEPLSDQLGRYNSELSRLFRK